MLRISIDRIDDLLDRASAVQVVLDAETDGGDATVVEIADVAEVLADDPAYVQLAEMLGALTTDEAYELLALSMWARDEAAADEWQTILEKARIVPEATTRSELMRALLLSDEIETALERLGYPADDEEAEDEEVGDGGIEETEAKNPAER